MSRTTPSPKIEELAKRLLAYEAAAYNSSGEDIPAVFRVSEKVRRALSTLVGIAGFRALMVRALALATAEAPRFRAMQIKPDGSLEGSTGVGNEDRMAKGDSMLTAQLLGLLVTFIGERLTLNIVRDVWPDLPAFDTLEKKRL